MPRKSTKRKKSSKSSKKFITMDKGALHPYRLKRHDGKSGYLAAETRHNLLRQTHAKGKNWTTIGRSLNALYVFNKNNNTTLASKAKADSNWAFKQAKKSKSRKSPRSPRTPRTTRKKSTRKSPRKSKGTGTAAPFPFNLLNF